MNKKEKQNRIGDKTLKIIKEILDCNKGAQRAFAPASEVDKEKSEPKPEESIAKGIKLRKEKIAEIEEEETNINDLWFKHYFADYQSPSDMYEKLCETERCKK